MTGVAWGLCGSAVIYMDILAATVILSTLFYWLLRVKLEYANHTLGATIVFITAFLRFMDKPVYFVDALMIFFAITALGYTNSYLKERARNPLTRKSLRLRLWIYTIPLLYTFYTKSVIPFITILSGMTGTELITYFGHRFHLENRR